MLLNFNILTVLLPINIERLTEAWEEPMPDDPPDDPLDVVVGTDCAVRIGRPTSTPVLQIKTSKA